MDYTVFSRETEHDYTWDNSHASRLLAECAQERFAPAFEGSLTTSRFAAFLRSAESLDCVILCVSVSTKHIDFRHRPIRTMAFLRAENSDEAKLLAAFFAECLRKSDAETLCNAVSDVAKAVESLCQRKNANEFVRFCKTLPPVGGNGSALKKRVAFPRVDMGERQSLANSLSAVIDGDSPFLFVLTDRMPTDVLGSLGSMFDHATIKIFSKATTEVEELPEPASQKYRWAAAIGGAVILVFLAAAIRSCSREGGGGRPGGSANGISSAISGGVTEASASTSGGSGAANTVPFGGQSEESGRKP